MGSERTSFRWQDGERFVRFGRGALADAAELVGEGYVLLTTPRALASLPALERCASSVHHVPAGRVDELAASLRGAVDGSTLLALGGGRVIDVTKALAAADPPRRVMAIPTTLSGAEMTPLHRHALGVAAGTPTVRPALVISDPALSASQPEADLAASALNALAHAVEAPLTPLASPVSTLAALEGARLLVGGFSDTQPDRDAVALGALLAGYAAGASVFGLHHVMAQTAVRLTGIGHGRANAILLPHTIPALTRRFPDAIGRLGQAMGGDPAGIASTITARTGTARLRECAIAPDQLEACAKAAAEQPALSLTPPRADREELLELYRAAW